MGREAPQKTLCLVPCFNEGENLPHLLREIQAANLSPGCDWALLDDGSTDGSSSILKNSGFPLIIHPKNAGYGAAVKSGFRYARERGYVNLAVFPGDRQRSLADLNLLLKEMENRKADLVVGSKTHAFGKIPWRRALGNRLFSAFAGLFWRSPIRDVLSGFKVYRVAAALPFLDFLPNRYEFDLVFSLYCGRFGLSVIEVPVSVKYHAHSTKMKSEVGVGLRMLVASLKSLCGRNVRPLPHPLGE